MTTTLLTLALRRPHPALLQRAVQQFVLRPVSVAVALAASAPASLALPQGAQVRTGQAEVKLASPTQLNIQQASPRAGIDWTSFSIGSNERVVVSQPDRASVLLNRVVGNDPSLIFGSLQSNGTVWLINPRGIVFGANSRVDVGGLLASTLSISNEDMASGRLLLGRLGGAAGAIRSDGEIQAIDGSVVLVAPQLSQGGRITARRIGLAAASQVEVDVEGDGLIFFNARNDGSLATRLNQLGTLRADGGTVELRAAARAGFADTVLNLEGVVEARSIGRREGRIVIEGGADGVTRVAGRLDASGRGPDERGGDILVLGQQVGLTGGALLDATGLGGGGGIRVGGGFQGHDASLRNAEMVTVQAGARLDASALGQGDGGNLVVWSDRATHFFGSADARGGIASGDGGRVEISGKDYLNFAGNSDRTAPQGKTGLLLLDPTNLQIVLAGPDRDGSGGVLDLAAGTLAFGAAGVNSKITAAAVRTQLGLGDVLLQAVDTLTVTQGFSSAATNALRLEAGKDVVVNSALTTGGAITLSASTAAITGFVTTGKVTVAADVTAGGLLTLTNGGGLNTGVHAVSANLSGDTLALTGAMALTGAPKLSVASGSSNLAFAISGAGSLEKLGAGVLVLSGLNTYGGGTLLTAGTLGLGNSAALGTVGAISFGGGTLQFSASNTTDYSARFIFRTHKAV